MKALLKRQQSNESSTTTSTRAGKQPIGDDFLYGDDLKEKSLDSMKDKEQENSHLGSLMKNEADMSSWMNLESARKLGKDDKDGKDGKDASSVNEMLLKRMKERIEQDAKVNVIYKSRGQSSKIFETFPRGRVS